jgi:hypothetical protein
MGDTFRVPVVRKLQRTRENAIMRAYDLLDNWFRLSDWAAGELMKDGCESLVLKPLAKFPKASAFIIGLGARSENYQHRKLVASLTGFAPQAGAGLLRYVFEQETQRDRGLAKDDARRLFTQSVMENVVFAASRWMRDEKGRAVALEVLRAIVERAIGGEYWNSAAYALTTLCKYQAEGHGELLQRFQQFANGGRVDHPSRPSLTQEKDFARNLAARNPATLDAIEDILNQADAAADPAILDENSRSGIEALTAAARAFDASSEEPIISGLPQ